MFSEKELRAAATELNEVLTLTPPINVKKLKVAALTEKVKEAIRLIKPEEDTFTDETKSIIDEIGGNSTEDAEENEDELLDDVEGAKTLKDLKSIVEDNDEFESLRDDLDTYKKADALREDMIQLLDEPESEEDDKKSQKKADKIHKKNVADKEVNQVKTEKMSKKEKKAAKKAAKLAAAEVEETGKKGKGKEGKEGKEGKVKKGPIKKAGKEGQPGIIATIASLVENSGKKGISKKEIIAELMETFPDRNEASMKNTVNVQVPARLNKEKFPVKKVGDDRYTKA